MPHNISIQLSCLGDILRSLLKARWLNRKLQRLKRKTATVAQTPVTTTPSTDHPFRDNRDLLIQMLQEQLKTSEALREATERRCQALEEGHRIWVKLYLILIGFVRIKHVETEREALLRHTSTRWPLAAAVAFCTLFGGIVSISKMNEAPPEPASIQIDHRQDPSWRMDAEFAQFDASLPAGRESEPPQPPPALLCYEPFIMVTYRAQLERPNQCTALPEPEVYNMRLMFLPVPCDQNPPFR